MWQKSETKRKMHFLHEAHTYYLGHTLEVRQQLFIDFMSNEEYVAKEKNIFLLKSRRDFYIDLPMIKIWEHEVNTPNDSVMNEISDNPLRYSERVNHNLSNVKIKQHHVLAFICTKHKEMKENPFLFFCEEIKRWIIALPTVNDTNYELVMELIKAKENYIKRVIRGEVFHREEDFLFDLLKHLRVLKSIFFQNHKDQNIIQSLFDLREKLSPMKEEFLAFLYFIFRRKSSYAEGYTDKNNLGEKVYGSFNSEDLNTDEIDDYISTFLNPMIETGSSIDKSILCKDMTFVLGRSESEFLFKLNEVKDVLISSHDGNQDFIDEFKKAQRCFYNLHTSYERLLKIHRAVHLLHEITVSVGSMAFHNVLKDVVTYIFSEFDQFSKETKRDLENIYDHLMQFYRNTEKGEHRIICLGASEYARDRILNIIRSCEIAKNELNARIFSYSYEMDIADAYSNLIELVDLCKAFGAPEDFYSNVIIPLEEYTGSVISQNPHGFYTSSVSVTEVNDDEILLISHEPCTQDVIERFDDLYESLENKKLTFGES